ncbi:MAG: hypothetical protein JSV77_06080 [Dehalococcoidales bacterium]|nr:MAG: hypothetical protein JSV77_06080 [Dehalococcoidales bacterium]
MSIITFATMSTQNNLTRAIILFDSLRTFGGELADSHCIMLISEKGEPLPDKTREQLSALDVNLVHFDMDKGALRFPLASLVYAAARAEQQVRDETEILVWMNEDTLIVNPPVGFLLEEGVNFAYRPVHHTRIGSVYDKPLDDFWSMIYQHCGVTGINAFPMETCTRDNVIRAYFNAGLLAVRPKQSLLATWLDYFERLYQHPDFIPFFKDDVLYMIFMHQAVLSGVVLSMFQKDELLELPETFNYPLHLHQEYPIEYQPQELNNLITCRYEGIEDLRNSLKAIPAEEPLKSWLDERIGLTDM